MHDMSDCDIVVNKFEFQFCNYVDFCVNTFGNDMKLLISTSYALKSTTTLFFTKMAFF